MTDIVNLSPGHVGEPLENARTFRYGGHTSGWVVDTTETLLADVRSELSAGPYNAFAESHSATSFDVTIDTGEAVVAGAALARDTTTTVTVSSNTTNQTIYVGWADGSKDTVVVGLDGAFLTSNPKIPIWTVDTDGSGVTATTDERDIGAFVDVANQRYEGGGTKVDAAKSADQIAGISLSQLVRGDQNDITDGVLGLSSQGVEAGTLGNSDGEVFRAPGGTSDFVFNAQGGHGRILFAWNAYYDGPNSTWRSIVANEPHAAIGMNNIYPGDGTDNGNIALATAPSNGAAGDAISWSWVSVGPGANLDLNGNQLQGAVIEHRTSRPASPTPGRLIYRTDKD